MIFNVFLNYVANKHIYILNNCSLILKTKLNMYSGKKE